MSSATTTQPNEQAVVHRVHKSGVVTRAAADKTRQVVINRLAKHPKYGKYIRRRTVLNVHDEKNVSQVGDKVEIMSCRPMSKTKRWTLVRVVGHEEDIPAPTEDVKTPEIVDSESNMS